MTTGMPEEQREVLWDGGEFICSRVGLAGMRERATRIGGLLKISSSATEGTVVQLSVPASVGFQRSSTD